MAKSFALVLGLVLSVVGVWGMLSGGHDHELIVFGINMTHNLVHVLSGALAIAAGLMGAKPAKLYCLAFGAVYGLVTVAGFANLTPVVTLLNLNAADNFLHLAISAACLGIGFADKSA